ncbi:MAG: hypothetical protein NTZ84_03255 [Candidatus Nealsonbacteria bacterium]|nr:hypothetical protein [Candidatus Nealsonbacteria bacterium]
MEETPKKEQTNIMAIISYIVFLCLIPILTKEKDEFISFHAKQGLVLFIGEAAAWVIFSFIPFLWPLNNLLRILWLVLSIVGIINVVNKEKKELPLLGKFAEKIKY